MNPNRLILPPDYPKISDRLIFTAGPIQGAPNWHERAYDLIHNQNPDQWIASPKREYLDGTFDYCSQVIWEREQLKRASRNGVILFWLAKEVEHNCDRCYAQTSRVEYGKISEWCKRTGCKVVIGIEEGYSGAKYVRLTFELDAPYVPFCTSLEETCATALRFLKA